MRNAPFLVRIAGLPASVLDDFTSLRCLKQAVEVSRLEAGLVSARALMIQALFDAVRQATPRLRRFLLDVKRDCFNGRSLLRHCDRAEWADLQQQAREPADQVTQLESKLALARENFKQLYQAERMREREALFTYLDDHHLLRGIVLASQEACEGIERLREQPRVPHDRKERRAERTLLRYVSRAAVKMSPYSTLTRVGLGTAGDGTEHRLRLFGDGWCERSLVRVSRYLVDQYQGILLQYPPIRAGLRIELNDTIEELDPGVFGFLRPVQLTLDDASGELQYVRASQVKVRLEGPLIESLRGHLAAGPTVYRRLVDTLQEELFRIGGDGNLATRIQETLERLLSLGFLRLLAPWPSTEVYLERGLLDYLRSLPEQERLLPLVGLLEELVAREEEYSTSRDPRWVLQRIDQLVVEIWHALGGLVSTSAQLSFQKKEKHNYYEDVFVSCPSTAEGEILQVPRKTVAEILETANVLWALGTVHQSRYSFLHSLAHFIRERWPNASKIPFLNVFPVALPLWQSYASFRLQNSEAVFNPFGLKAISDWVALRDSIRDGLHTLLDAQGYSGSLPLEPLRALAERLPPAYRPSTDSCIFVQPVDSKGEVWVLNRIFEGTGRFGSRFTAVMGEEQRERYLQHFAERSEILTPTSTARLVDLLYSHENTVNLHWPQTAQVLEIPGEDSNLPSNRRLRLRDLWVRIDPATALPLLVDIGEHCCLPCHLSAVNNHYMPVLLKFLGAFGPISNFGHVILPWMTHKQNGVAIAERLTAGRLVIRRKRWIVPSGLVPMDSVSAAQSFLEINRWRRNAGIPDEVFVMEKVSSTQTVRSVYKPQFINFCSPSFVELFQSILEASEHEITFEEALPVRTAFPRNVGTDLRWGVELMLDSLAFSSNELPPVVASLDLENIVLQKGARR